MNRKQFRSQASSGRVGGFGGFGGSGLGSSSTSLLSYIQEPPNFSDVSDANVVVCFKNLSKKDSTTKAKALEDLQTHVSGNEVEEAVLEIWVKLFPRLSIDSARRVRQLTHIVNGQICSRAGKRTAKHMARIVGPWLAGTYDSDRATAKAAQEALQLVFPTPEKLRSLRKAFHAQLLEFSKDSVLQETVQSLSDERVVSKDDAEAIYARVVATSLMVITSLLSELSSNDIQQQHHVYEEFLGDKKLWEYPSHEDAGVRRAVHRLVRACLDKLLTILEQNLKLISTAYVYKGLPSNQTGSGQDFLLTLRVVTKKYPTVWTSAYAGKRSAASRLRKLLEKGSHSDTAEYWQSLEVLLQAIPRDVFPQTHSDAQELLAACREGVHRKEERFNALAAWHAYFTLTNIICKLMSSEEQDRLLDADVTPVFRRYLQPSSDASQWSITGSKASAIVAQAALVQGALKSLAHQLTTLADDLIEMLKLAQPEQSKDFDKSQTQVAAAGEHWAHLQRELLQNGKQGPGELEDAYAKQDLRVLSESFILLVARNGKPYGVAAVASELLRACPYLLNDTKISGEVLAFVLEQAPRLLFSLSQKQILDITYVCETDSRFAVAFGSMLDAVSDEGQGSDIKLQAIRTLFSNRPPQQASDLARQNVKFQRTLSSLYRNANTGGLLADLLSTRAIANDTTDELIGDLIDGLSVDSTAERFLKELEIISRSNAGILHDIIVDSEGPGKNLLPRLLQLEQSANDSIAEQAHALSTKLSSTPNGAPVVNRFRGVIDSLENTSEQSMPMSAVLQLNDRLLGPNKKAEDIEQLLPDTGIWQAALSAIARPPRPSLALLSSLSGGVHFVDDTTTTSKAVFDGEGLSQASRIAMFMTHILKDPALQQKLDKIVVGRIMFNLSLTLLLVEDNVSLANSNGSFQFKGLVQEHEILEFESEAQIVLNSYWASINVQSAQPSENSGNPLATLQQLFDEAQGQNTLAYYSALAYCKTTSNLFESQGVGSEKSSFAQDRLKSLYRGKPMQHFQLLAYLNGNQRILVDTQTLNRICNELVADLTDSDFVTNPAQALEQLVILNACLHLQDSDTVSSIAKQRLIFLVKNLLTALQSDVTPVIEVEICRSLAILVQGMQDTYGDYWEQLLSYVTTFWTSLETELDSGTINDHQVLLVFATLKLYGAIRNLSKSDETNDDLVDALKDNREKIAAGLIHLLRATNGVSDELDQPLMVTNELLAREISSLPPAEPVKEMDHIYTLLYAPSRSVQHAAFELMHKGIPVHQEQISFDAALENKTAHLPDELLSLILEAPTLDSLADASFDRTMPLALQGYLFGWRLIFDHFTNSSYKVKGDYIEQIKEGGHLPGLMNLIFDFLGLSQGKLIDASRFDITEYRSDEEPTPERDVQWLLTHIYYLSLTYMPSLVKNYFLSIRSRQTSQAVENWTSKYISPLIVASSLESVAEWAEKSVKEDPDYEKMTVKVGMRAKEITASYVVDEQTMAIRVALPDAYPLTSAQVVGVNRVAVKEEKWQSWLRNCQGVITFSNGSIIDGLSSWRRNVVGALKGQTECAICYSIISGDKQLPTKKCPTCKHLFHNSCLFKWFKTSNASTCPLCRNAFNFN
ncbi:hypothetical protein K431DRAFT_316027 [Polychaeton citri CBS 116435]|uniref:E3 ubiquitin-protein ligase listerin n=1 Tax=Polychaeton citri CBS 116435 TaxID=1314669 RepID=A0A9P4UK49_9PEZI|nr:hypothetical protein K431DRAFT_316027 [Polychaeton citri CBS 116435]